MASPGKKAFALRIDPALWAEVERLAAAELRSANAQVEVLLREALRERLGEAAMRRLAPARRAAAGARSAGAVGDGPDRPADPPAGEPADEPPG